MKMWFFFPLLLFLLPLLPIFTQDLKILTEEDPPYNYIGTDGKLTGYAVEVVREIQNRIGSRDAINLYPWARGMEIITNSPHVVLFTMARIKERNPLFQWVGPITENRWILVTLKKSPMMVNTLDEARKLDSIGVVRDFSWDKYLTEVGFTNLQRTVRNTQNVLKLNAGRIQAYVSTDNTFKQEITSLGLNPQDYKELMTIHKVQIYIAHSKTTEKSIVDQWQSALDAMKADGTLEKLIKKWLPGRGLPDPGRVPTF